MSRIFVTGFGAVSSAGWGVPSLRAALDKGEPLPVASLPRPGRTPPLAVRPVPDCQPRPACLAHPRLRRCSPITHYAVAAAVEALGAAPARRLGVLVCLQAGCVQYSYRFYQEVLRDPATASPMIFPETVLAAPGSHVAAVLGHAERVETLLGDPATFLQAAAIGSEWLLSGQVDTCLVIGAEEINWLLGEAIWLFHHQTIFSGGAGALCLRRDPAQARVELAAITDAWRYAKLMNRTRAARQMRAELPATGAELLCDGLQNCSRIDGPERAAWQDWRGARLSPKTIVGEAMVAGAALQCVAACDAVASGRFSASLASLVGCNQQAIGARFCRA